MRARSAFIRFITIEKTATPLLVRFTSTLVGAHLVFDGDVRHRLEIAGGTWLSRPDRFPTFRRWVPWTVMTLAVSAVMTPVT